MSKNFHKVYAADCKTFQSAYAPVRQRCKAKFQRLFLQQSLIILVRRGSKSIVVDGKCLSAEEGGVIALSAGVFADFTNIPDTEGIYEAEVFSFYIEELQASDFSMCNLMRFGSFVPPHAFADSIASARNVLSGHEKVPRLIAQNRIRELLLWTRSFGIGLQDSTPISLPLRVRQVVGREPSFHWKVSDIATQLAMSEPTMRRQLAAEGTRASEIITDVRLTHALGMLQATRASINQISLESGYESPSKFAARFRARFGVSPNEIRGKL